MQKSTQIERLSKVIARNTSYSRRQAEKLIDEGRVSVDGKKNNFTGDECLWK